MYPAVVVGNSRRKIPRPIQGTAVPQGIDRGDQDNENKILVSIHKRSNHGTCWEQEMSFRNTKIVATLGPASSSPEVVRSMVEAG
ncbi:MAG: hypothetical protein DMG06_21475, partial [Acidobacteria bacterium]